MQFYSGPPMHFLSGVDTRALAKLKIAETSIIVSRAAPLPPVTMLRPVLRSRAVLPSATAA